MNRLPAPITASWEWQIDAACRDIDNTVFFHPANERGQAKDTRDNHAKAICRRCPVIEACRRHALTVHEPYGVWGGLTIAERTALLRQPDAVASSSHTRSQKALIRRIEARRHG